MASGNFVFNNPAFQQQSPQQQTPGLTPPSAMGTQTQTSAMAHQSIDAAANAQMEGMYAAPPAGSIETGRMTIEDTVMKTLGLFAVLVVGAVAGWLWTMAPGGPQGGGVTMAPWIIGALGGFVMAMVVIFTSRKKVRPALIFAYAAFEGLFVGGISAFFEILWPGIVLQATAATLTVVGVVLALFASGKIRASKKVTKIFMVAMFSYLAFSLLNVVLMWTGAVDGMFGLRSGPLGIVIGLIVILMASYSLVLDFDEIQQGVRNGAAREYGWLGGFGIMVTVVWLYVEILRLIAILRGDG